MAIMLSAGSRELVPAGLQLCICTEMIELGTSVDTFQGESKRRRKVWLAFEAVDEERTDAEGNPYRLSIGSTYTASLGKEATLRKSLEAWRNKPFTMDELKAFDLKNVLGAACNITVTHQSKTDGSGVTAKISSISPLGKSQTKPEQMNPTKLFEFDKFDEAILDTLPEFLQKEIRRSEEFELHSAPKFTGHGSQQQPGFKSVFDEDESNDLPF